MLTCNSVQSASDATIIYIYFFPLLRARSLCGGVIKLPKPHSSELFGAGLAMFIVWCGLVCGAFFDDWITYSQNNKWSFNIGLYKPCLSGGSQCKIYIAAGFFYSFSIAFLLLASLTMLVRGKLFALNHHSPCALLFHFFFITDDCIPNV